MSKRKFNNKIVQGGKKKGSNEEQRTKDTEIFILAQFIKVMEVLEKYEKIEGVKEEIKNRKRIYLEHIKEMNSSVNFLSLNLNDEDIDCKIEKCSRLYSTSKEYKQTLKKFETKYEDLIENLEQRDREKLDEVRGLIYEMCNYDVHLAYKIGLIEGIKVKSE